MWHERPGPSLALLTRQLGGPATAPFSILRGGSLGSEGGGVDRLVRVGEADGVLVSLRTGASGGLQRAQPHVLNCSRPVTVAPPEGRRRANGSVLGPAARRHATPVVCPLPAAGERHDLELDLDYRACLFQCSSHRRPRHEDFRSGRAAAALARIARFQADRICLRSGNDRSAPWIDVR